VFNSGSSRCLELSVVQLEETKRFIQTGKVPYLRLALLLLDNAAEILMHRVIRDELTYSEWYDRMATLVRTSRHEDDERYCLLSEYERRTIPKKRAKGLDRDFNQKVDFLSQERHQISLPVARILKHIHAYRNEAYHNDRVRPDSIQPAVLILFDVVCTLLSTIPPVPATRHEGDSGAWMERYGFGRFGDIDEIRTGISEALRLGLPLEIAGIRRALATHLSSRLDEIDENIDFIAKNARPRRDREEVLKAVQYWNVDRQRAWEDGDPTFVQFRPRYTLASTAQWRREAAALETIADKMELFNRFADIEDAFEPLEGPLNEAAALIDRHIQGEVDERRGK
jgi:hypothetical protein